MTASFTNKTISTMGQPGVSASSGSVKSFTNFNKSTLGQPGKSQDSFSIYLTQEDGDNLLKEDGDKLLLEQVGTVSTWTNKS